LLGLPRLVPQSGQRSEPQRAGGVGVVGNGDSRQYMVEQCLVDLIAGELGIPDRLADLVEVRACISQRDAGPAAAQVDKRDDAAEGNPGAVCSAASAATESGTSAAGTPFGARLGVTRNAPLSAPTVPGPQCAGTAIAMGAPPPTVRAIASRASTSTRSPRCGEPSAATSGTGSPTRSTKPLSTRPRLLTFGFSPGTPTSGARSLNKVRTERRMTGARPMRAATKLVIPMDNPSE